MDCRTLLHKCKFVTTYMHSKGGGISLTCLTTANYNLSYSLVAFIDGFKGVRSNTPQK